MRLDISPGNELPAGDGRPRSLHEAETLLTVREVAALLKVPVSWIHEHTRQGYEDPLPVVRVGKYLGFFSRDILDDLAAIGQSGQAKNDQGKTGHRKKRV